MERHRAHRPRCVPAGLRLHGLDPSSQTLVRRVDDLLVDATEECFRTSGIGKDQIDAFWLGTMGSGVSGLTLSRPLKIDPLTT